MDTQTPLGYDISRHYDDLIRVPYIYIYIYIRNRKMKGEIWCISKMNHVIDDWNHAEKRTAF